MNGSHDARGVVVAFDFDGTLTTGDSVIPFLRRFVGLPRLLAGVSARPSRAVGAAVRRDRDALRDLATEVVFTDRPHAEVTATAGVHARHIVAHHLRTDTVARLDWHRSQGHEIVFVSASYDDYLRPVAAHVGAHDVVSTRLEVVNGRCTGRLAGANCRGAEKVRRLRLWLEASGRDRGDVELWAYGDSAGDRELLAWADRSVWVNEPLASVVPSR